MPKLPVHLWIADQLAARHAALKDPDFYLGSIAPTPFIQDAPTLNP
jgi:hypothetical protein